MTLRLFVALVTLLSLSPDTSTSQSLDVTDFGAFLHGEVSLILSDEADVTYILPAVALDSLPDGMPLSKRLLWGNSGLVRQLGLAPAHRADELRLRRQMLQWHQALGLATWAAMTVQTVTGGRMYDDLAENYQRYSRGHRTLGYATFGLYTASASLQFAAPPARRYDSGITNITVHRALSYVHFAGMMATPFLGVSAARANSPEAYRDALDRHRIVGIITYAAFSGAILAIFIPL